MSDTETENEAYVNASKIISLVSVIIVILSIVFSQIGLVSVDTASRLIIGAGVLLFSGLLTYPWEPNLNSVKKIRKVVVVSVVILISLAIMTGLI